MSQKLVLGADIGGSHVTVGIIDLQTNTVLSKTKSRLELNSKGDLESILTIWQKAIEKSCELFGSKPNFLGISMPGPLDYENGISLISGQDKYDALFGLNIKELLAERIQMPVNHLCFINDAVSFLQGEILGGAGKNGKNVIGLTLGTGLGSAKALNGSEVLDADLWKMPFKDAIAEEYLSTRWFVRRYKEITDRIVDNVKELHHLANEGNQDALNIFKEFGNNLGLFLQHFIALEGEVDTVVMGGNIAKTAHLFRVGVLDVLGEEKVKLKQAVLGEDAALIGAAGVWKKETQEQIV